MMPMLSRGISVAAGAGGPLAAGHKRMFSRVCTKAAPRVFPHRPSHIFIKKKKSLMNAEVGAKIVASLMTIGFVWYFTREPVQTGLYDDIVSGIEDKS